MPERRAFTRPVIIMGAPRSGTSLLHRILRAQPGFASLADESGVVWRELTHPACNDWKSEGWHGSKLTEARRLAIHRRLARHALGARIWRRADARAVGEQQHRRTLTGRLAAPGYRALTTVLSRFPSREPRRLVEKSVNNALWLDLIEQVFPDAFFVHIVRHPEDNLRSMVRAWLDPDRFFTYELPVALRIGGYPYQRWNFGLPPGWRDYVNRPLEQVVAFQWAALQERSISFIDRYPERTMRLKLEDLSCSPRAELERLADFLRIPWNRHMEGFARALPRVNSSTDSNAGAGSGPPPDSNAVRSALEPYAELVRAIGY